MPYVLLGIGIVMAITGAQAALSGWDIVLMERGWALMIAGSVLGTGGMIVAALGLVLIDLRRALPRTNAERTGFRLPGKRGARAPEPASADGMKVVLPGATLAASAATAQVAKDAPEHGPALPDSSLTMQPAQSSGETQGLSEVQPGELMAAKDDTAAPDEATAHADPVIPVSDEDFRMTGTSEATTAEPDPNPEPATSDAEPAATEVPEQPEMPQPDLADLRPPEAAQSVPTVVKTYTAGGHSYIMFSDGTIEADTPEGLFTFQSLEELKAFIAEKAGAANASAEEKV